MQFTSNIPATLCGDISVSLLSASKAVFVEKVFAGFDEAAVSIFRTAISAVSREEWPGLKFVVYDFAHEHDTSVKVAGTMKELIAANIDLVMESPVITIAWVRHTISGSDLEFALNCSMIIAEEGAQFSFAGDPFSLLGVYAALGRKIGFVQTERLIESVRPPSANEMHDLMLVKDVVPVSAGTEGIAAYLSQAERRHNAAQAIFRAQKMAERPIAA